MVHGKGGEGGGGSLSISLPFFLLSSSYSHYSCDCFIKFQLYTLKELLQIIRPRNGLKSLK